MTSARLSSQPNLGDRLLNQLAESGARVTRTRQAVLNALATRADGFTIEELCRDVQPVGRATVFRTIRLLVQEGLVCKLAMGDATPRYALARPGHHHHAVCVRCGAIDDFRGCDLDELVRRVASAAGSDVLGHRLEVYVVCATCRSSQDKVAAQSVSRKSPSVTARAVNTA